MDLKHRLKQLLEDRDLSQQMLARHLHIAESTLSQYLTGKRTPNIDMITRIADYFDVSIDYLVGRSDVKYNQNDRISRTEQRETLSETAGQIELHKQKELLPYYPVITKAAARQVTPAMLEIFLNAYLSARSLEDAERK